MFWEEEPSQPLQIWLGWMHMRRSPRKGLRSGLADSGDDGKHTVANKNGHREPK